MLGWWAVSKIISVRSGGGPENTSNMGGGGGNPNIKLFLRPKKWTFGDPLGPFPTTLQGCLLPPLNTHGGLLHGSEGSPPKVHFWSQKWHFLDFLFRGCVWGSKVEVTNKTRRAPLAGNKKNRERANRALVIVLWSRQVWGLQNAFRNSVFEASKLVSTKTPLLLKHLPPSRKKKRERAPSGPTRVMPPPPRQKTREGCGCFRGLFGRSRGKLRESPGKLLDKFSRIGKCYKFLGFWALGKANLPGTLGPHCRDLLPTFRAGCF